MSLLYSVSSDAAVLPSQFSGPLPASRSLSRWRSHSIRSGIRPATLDWAYYVAYVHLMYNTLAHCRP